MASDPGTMTRHERQTEVSTILATGYLRLLVARARESRKALAEPAESEAPCDHVVDRSETQHEEVTT